MKIRRKAREKAPLLEVPAAPVGRGVGRTGTVVLTLAAAGGAYVSWGSLYAAVMASSIGRHSPVLVVRGVEVNVAAAVTAALLDAAVLGASLKYVRGVLTRRPSSGWRTMAWAGIAATVTANLASADGLVDAGWHLIAPAVWVWIVENSARDVLGDMREVRAVRAEVIPLRLWFTAPVESARTSFRMLRTGDISAASVRLDADRRRAAADALRLELREAKDLSWQDRARTLRLAGRRLWAGTITPADVFTAIGWDLDGARRVDRREPADILRSILSAAARSDRIDSIGSDRAESPAIEGLVRHLADRVDSQAMERTGIRDQLHRLATRVESIQEPRVESQADPIADAFSGPAPIEASVAMAGSDRAVAAEGGSGAAVTEQIVEAREEDLERIRAAVIAEELAWPLRVTHVMTRLKMGPTYARVAVKQVKNEGDPRRAASAEQAGATGQEQESREAPDSDAEGAEKIPPRDEREQSSE